MQDKLKPLPWYIGELKAVIFSADNHLVANCETLKNAADKANAAYIVKCVNSHQALVDALRFYAGRRKGESQAELVNNFFKYTKDGGKTAEAALALLGGESVED